ncbi:MFS transporter [Dictyobacter aurantiacus]|uniref:Multidrug efflux pump Tap n=1 Tax=Dictyobacter aurantiacus TaxID=1936993 RepID=A0A401ZM96_9CHLR|nr:MFS transporter [Dictyobacter aurantiacus]GCE07896.1 MFS transporter [Dictyobacter aurantiacus]
MPESSEDIQNMEEAVLLPPTPEEALVSSHDSRRVLRSRDFRLLIIGSFLASFGQQMVTIAIGWELYDRTGSALVLGGVGLAQIIPVIVLFLPAGYIIDRYNRKAVLIASIILQILAMLGLAALSFTHGLLLLIYLCLLALGTAQCFSQPVGQVLLAQVVDVDAFEDATKWRSSITQLSAVLGPATGGFLIGLFNGSTDVYLISTVLSLTFIVLLIFMRLKHQQVRKAGRPAPGELLEGLRFLKHTQVLLAAITLDLFAVLLGGATSLLPVFAKSILHVGPFGLGWLQGADSVGAVCMALLLAYRPPFKHAGRTLLLAVAGFGVATIVFGLSHWFWLSLLALFVLGGLDNISVVIRSTLALVRTPDEMRGRVGAVSSLFIGTSNQLGGFESGLTAQVFGPIASVVGGGIGTILVVILVATLWPDMRNLRALREDHNQDDHH